MSERDYLLKPPYRCCGVFTRKIPLSTKGNKGVYSFVCHICAWSYRKDGTRRPNNGQLRKRADV